MLKLESPFLYSNTVGVQAFIKGIVFCFFFQAPKQYPFNDLYLEKGGDPEKQPEEVKHYEL